MNTRGRVVFIDDEAQLCEAAADWLEASGFSVATFTEPSGALTSLLPETVDCLVTDLRMPGLDGREVLHRVRAADQDLPVVVLSGHADVATAVELMAEGAFDLLEKPYVAEHLAQTIDRAVELRRMRRQSKSARWPEMSSLRLEARLAGPSAVMESLRETVRQIADVPIDLRIEGEPGVGKKEIARALHDFSRRARRPFVVIDCTPRPELAFEAELLGHERGFVAGTSAVRVGKLEYANGGTVFLDDIDRLSPALQARLLRVLQDRSIERIGSNSPRAIDVRIVAASHVDLEKQVARGLFRSDLYHRLSSVVLKVPPLRERREDIPVLYTRFIEDAAERLARPVPVLLPPDLLRLRMQDWTGNAAELKSTAERHVLALHLPLPGGAETRTSLPERLAQFEIECLTEALRLCNGRTVEAAEILGVPRRTLNEKIAKYGLRVE